VAEDFSECRDLAAGYPDKLRELVELWFVEAGRYHVLPLNRRPMGSTRPKPFGDRTSATYYPYTTRIDSETAVSSLYQAPFPFTGVLDQVTISVEGQGVLALQKEVERAFLTQ